MFGAWFGLCLPPITLGAIALSFAANPYLGTATVLLLALWVWDTARTTCCRCWAYGSAGCGLPSLVAPLLAARKSPTSVSRRRIRFHYYTDVGMAVYLNAIYTLCPVLLPAVLVWTVGAWWIAMGPKRHHGLLHQLRSDAAGERQLLRSLPVLEGDH
jgi:hypothetical protein